MTQAEMVSETTLKIIRTLNAPREVVFRAWTQPEQLQSWWGVGADYSTPIAEVDLRTGGKYRLGMQAPDRDEPFVVGGVFREVNPPERLVYTWVWEHRGQEADSGASSAQTTSGPESVVGPGETLVTVEFHDVGGATEVVLTHEYFPATSMRDEHSNGWSGCLDQLAKLMEGANL